ncbi:hypothetical protein EBU94_03500 [bacterium]|jgi:hypothetical protein|nr:hypothetical protein [bacterium]
MISDEKLIELAKIASELSDDDLLDVKYYQEVHTIFDGRHCLYKKHLYSHYRNWSIDPVSLEVFSDMLPLTKKTKNHFYINKELCKINLEKVLGDYVKQKREVQKKERFRQLPSSKSQTKR